MIDLLKEIIIDSQEAGFFTGVSRELIRVETLPGKASVFIGVRRSGKSTFMYQLIEGLKKSGVSEKNIVYINFVDERLHFLKEEGLSLITEAYYQMHPEKKKSEKVYFFFDEIQSIPEWESFVERLMRSENSAVYITGFSSKMLSEEIATQMRGRSMVYEVFPFSFPEFLKKKGN